MKKKLLELKKYFEKNEGAIVRLFIEIRLELDAEDEMKYHIDPFSVLEKTHNDGKINNFYFNENIKENYLRHGLKCIDEIYGVQVFRTGFITNVAENEFEKWNLDDLYRIWRTQEEVVYLGQKEFIAKKYDHYHEGRLITDKDEWQEIFNKKVSDTEFERSLYLLKLKGVQYEK